MAKLLVLVRIALANLVSSFLNVFVGLVLAFGAALLVVGGSLFGTLDQALSKSIVGSVTGHLQVYGARSKDKLEVYGKVDGSDATLAPLDDWKKLKAQLHAVPNVAEVVPMGACTTLVTSGNTVNLTLERLRSLYRAQADPSTRLPDDVFQKRAASVKAHVRNMVTVLARDAERAEELSKADADVDTMRAALKEASAPEFWTSFDADPFGHLEILENKVAPEVGDGDMLFIRALGTDLDAYQATFDRLHIIEGTQVPKGHRGVLLPRFFVEEYFKLKNARRLDKIREGRSVGRTIASDKELQRLVKENQNQNRELVLQLDGDGTREATARLQKFLRTQETDLPKMFTELLSTTDENFDARDKFFFDSIAPLVSLYRSRVGDTITLKSFGRSGSLESVPLKFYGIFELRGLEKSPIAGANALVDMVSFRLLYGYMTAEKKAELDAIKLATAVKEVSRETAEADLFGGDATLVEKAEQSTIADEPKLAHKQKRSDTYEPQEIDDGLVLHAALMLKDGSPAAVEETRLAVEKVLNTSRGPVKVEALTAVDQLLASGRTPAALKPALEASVALERARAKGLLDGSVAPLLQLDEALRTARRTMADADVKAVEALITSARPTTWVVDWATAAGFLGQFIGFFRMILVLLLAAFAFIALIVVVIGVTIATLQRTQTIGTMRAIGAQRSFVTSMVLVETVVLGLVFGVIGVALGSGVVLWLHSSGIPAFRDELYFFFSGPTLRPEVTMSAVLLSLATTVAVSLVAVLFPMFMATRVSPLTAMQASE